MLKQAGIDLVGKEAVVMLLHTVSRQVALSGRPQDVDVAFDIGEALGGG